MEQQLKCTFRGPPSTVNVYDHQHQEDHLAADGWCLLDQSAEQTGDRISPHGVPIELGGR